MVAKKKQNAPEGDIPKSAWGKAPVTEQADMEFDPSRVAGILSGKSGEQLDTGSTADEAVAETHAAEGWEAPFRDGYKEEQFTEEYPETVAAAPAPKGKKPARDKKRAPVEDAPAPKNINGELIAFVERIERLMEEGKTIREDIKEVCGEAKGTGFDVATIKRVIAYRAKDPDKVAEQEALFDTYFNAIGGHR